MDPGTGACLIVNRDSAKVTIIFATHATSLDNERGLAPGWYDADRSPQGIEQARELGARYAEERFEPSSAQTSCGRFAPRRSRSATATFPSFGTGACASVTTAR
jgi:hypothetical protein